MINEAVSARARSDEHDHGTPTASTDHSRTGPLGSVGSEVLDAGVAPPKLGSVAMWHRTVERTLILSADFSDPS